MCKPTTLIVCCLLGIGILPLLGAPATDQEFVKNISLTEYTCAFSPFTSVPLLFVNYKIRNDNAITFYELTLNYKVEYQDANGIVIKEGEATVTPVIANWTKQDRVLVVSLPGEKPTYKVGDCKAWISGFYKEVPVTKKRTVTVKTGDKINVAADCRDDYAKLQTMKPGVEKREFAAKLVRLGCVSTEPVYGKKSESYQDKEWIWVEYKQ